MIPINDYLGGVLEGFQAYLREGHQLCDLKALNYDQGQVPNYEDLHVQQYYLLGTPTAMPLSIRGCLASYWNAVLSMRRFQ